MDLTDDVLLMIFEYLNVRDQLSAALACPRFHNIFITFWNLNELKEISIEVPNVKDDHLRILLESICSSVEVMKIAYVVPTKWNIIKKFSYPNVRSLLIFFAEFPSYTENDDPVELSKQFPNLRSLRLAHKDILEKSPYAFKNLKSLEDLNLTYCTSINAKHLEKLLEETHLKSITICPIYGPFKWTSYEARKNFYALERIYLESYSEILGRNFSRFTNLRELNVEDYENNKLERTFRNVSTHKHNEIIEIHVSGRLQLSAHFVMTFENLITLKLYRQDMSNVFDISVFPNLRELFFVNCDGLRQDYILRFLKSVQLEFVELSECRFEFRCFDLSVDEVVKNREKLLHINFGENKHHNGDHFEKVELNRHGSSSLLKITHLPPNANDMGKERILTTMRKRYIGLKFR